MREEKLYIAWRSPWSRSWWPVGLLTRDEKDVYRFSYTKGALRLHKVDQFETFVNMPNLFAVYQSDELFSLFNNRLLPRVRPEYEMHLNWMDIKEKSDDVSFTMLAMTEGIRGTDMLEVFRCPERNKQGKYDIQFFIHGIRYLAGQSMERINTLTKKDKLFFMIDFQNEFDYWAIALRTEDPLAVVGYCPRYLTEDIYTLLGNCEPNDIKVYLHKVNKNAPQQYKLLCRLVAPWPKGFQPCSGEEYEPIGIIQKKEVNKEMTGNQYKFGRSKEHKVARSLRGKGATAKLSPGSRGAADVTAKFPSGKTWKVQVKATRGSHAASPSRRDLGRLKQSASRSGATPVVAKVTPKGTHYTSARSGKKLKP